MTDESMTEDLYTIFDESQLHQPPNGGYANQPDSRPIHIINKPSGHPILSPMTEDYQNQPARHQFPPQLSRSNDNQLTRNQYTPTPRRVDDDGYQLAVRTLPLVRGDEKTVKTPNPPNKDQGCKKAVIIHAIIASVSVIVIAVAVVFTRCTEDCSVGLNGDVNSEEAAGEACLLMNYAKFCGSSGGMFTDYDSYKTNGRISKIEVCNATTEFRADSITMTYGNVLGDKHGVGEDCVQYVLNTDEVITGVSGAFGIDSGNYYVLHMIEFQTNASRTFGPFGNKTDQVFSYNAAGRSLAFIAGKFGASIDQITFYFECQK